jgi:hypothetical protein
LTASRFPDAPAAIQALKVDARGYPVPYFVSWIAGEPEFRAVDPRKIERAHNRGLCWICGEPMAGQVRAFAIGPMCAINRLSAEPPGHVECVRFAVTACPFLSRPMAKRRPMEGQMHPPAGLMIQRNPGVTLIWHCRAYRKLRIDGGLLFRIGSPHRLEWFAEGRPATRAEVLESFETGEPILRRQAELDGPKAVELFETMLERAERLLPA